MKYKDDTSSTPLTGVPSINHSSIWSAFFIPWQPSTWPKVEDKFDDNFHRTIERIFRETIINEIDNVINDAIKSAGSLEHRGHIIAIVQLCAIDTLSSYAFFDKSSEKCKECGRTDSKINKYKTFIESFFPGNYNKYSKEFCKLYRNTMIHSWNLFEAGITPDNSELKNNNGTLCFGLLNFQDAIKSALNNYLEELKSDEELQKNTMARYEILRRSAKK